MHVTLEQAQIALVAAQKRAVEIDTRMCIAVVDSGANLKAFMRTDDAWVGSRDIAVKKAKTACFFGMPTGQMPVVTTGRSLVRDRALQRGPHHVSRRPADRRPGRRPDRCDRGERQLGRERSPRGPRRSRGHRGIGPAGTPVADLRTQVGTVRDPGVRFKVR
jgi:Haem degrading protein HbpS-like